ncbi:hypothetical protein V8E54_009811 [Elaphomyces granulatus]
MATKKNMRRADLVIPYVDPPKPKNESDMTGIGTCLHVPDCLDLIWQPMNNSDENSTVKDERAMSTTMPMAAMFTRSRMIGWVSFVYALQTWLAETPEQRRTGSTPAYMTVFMSFMALIVVRFPVSEFSHSQGVPDLTGRPTCLSSYPLRQSGEVVVQPPLRFHYRYFPRAIEPSSCHG